MNEQPLSAVVARAAAMLALVLVPLLWVWPATLGHSVPLPAWAALPGAAGLSLLLLAPAVWLAAGGDPFLPGRLGAAAVGFAALVLLSWLVSLLAGEGRILAWSGPQGFVAGTLALRPPVLLALGVAALGGALWTWRPGREQVDPAALLASLAAALFFLVFLGHLFGSATLTAGTSPMVAPSTGLSAALLLALSLCFLGLHRAGPLAAYAGTGPGPAARRRLLPAAILIPLAMGFLLLYALEGRQLSPTLAIALTVFANVLVMLLLIDRTGEQVARMDQERTERMRAREERVRRQGMRDALTGALNRRGWDEEVRAIEARCRVEGLDAGILVIDLDDLKRINDSEGHKAGDAYIQRAAGALRRVARRRDVLARVGGDEFVYLAVGCDEPTTRAVAQRLQESLQLSKVKASVGYAMRGARSIEEAFEEADRAMYEQKRERKLRRA